METIIADEIGIEFARIGEYRVRAHYRPVYRKSDGTLAPVAAQGRIAVTAGGEDVPVEAVLDEESSLIGLKLIVRNHAHSFAEALDLYVDFPENSELETATLNELAPKSGQRFVTFLKSGDHRQAERLRDAGFGIGLIADLVDDRLADRIAIARPEVIRIGEAWFNRTMHSEALAALLRRFVAACHDTGAQVWFAEAHDRQTLQEALGVDVDLFAGKLIGPAMPAGAAMDLLPLSLADLTTPNVVPFTRRSRSG